MRTLLTLLVISSLVLSGCGRLRESKLNPGNWFGNSRSAPVSAPSDARAAETEEANPLIPAQTTIFKRNKAEVYEGTAVDQVTGLTVERLPTGAIVHVTGLSLRQGAYDVRLTSKTDGKPVDGVLTFALEALQPQDQPQGPQSTRHIEVARFVPALVLEQTRSIQVIAARNVRTTTR